MAPVVVLLSGGVDSATVCLHYSLAGREIISLFIDYGQHAAPTEWECAQRVTNVLGVPVPLRVQLVRPQDRKCSLTAAAVPLPASYAAALQQEFFPQRNLILGAVAASVAAGRGADAVAFGFVDGARAHYPDCTPAFVGALTAVVGLSGAIGVEAPFIENSKYALVKYGLDHGLDYAATTYSCNRQAGRHCGVCASCIERARVLSGRVEVEDVTVA